MIWLYELMEKEYGQDREMEKRVDAVGMGEA